MGGYAELYPGDLQSLVSRLLALEEAVQTLTQKALRIPILDADPPVGDPTNIWVFADGRLRVRMPDGSVKNYIHSEDSDFWPNVPVLASDPAASTGIDIWALSTNGQLSVRHSTGIVRYNPATAGAIGATTSSAPPPTSDVPKPGTTTPVSYQKTYNSTWSQSYHQAGSQRSDTNDLYYGRIESFHGENRSMVGFNHGAIAADLAGATISKVEVYIRNKHSYFNSGVDLHIGTHNQSAKPANYAANRTGVSSPHYGKTESAWRTISDNFGNWFRDGSAKGLVFDQPSTSSSYYGYADNNVSLRITYVK